MRLLERDTPLCTLEALLGRARDGAGALVFVSGEAGIGKTALLRRFVAQVCPPVATWWGSCDPLQTPTALGPILEIVRQMAGRARQLDFDQPRVELFSALLQLLAERPAVVVIEDLHWADEATLDWLRYLGRRIDRTRTLLVTSYRDDELSPTHPLRVLLGDLATQRVPRLALAPLSVAAVGTLVDGTAIDAAVLHRQTGGNPFYVTEVVAIGGIGLPECVRDAVMARAARLAAPARALLDIAAVCGPRIEPWLLECLIGAEAAAVDECLALGVLRVEGEVFVFRHELARQAVLDSIAPWRRVALHRNVLQALEATHSEDLARLVHHAALGQLSDAVLRWAPAAAASAARHGAHREAAAHYGTALGHAASLAPEQRADLLERRSYECYLTADIAASVHARETALALRRQLGQRTREGDDVRWLSRLAWFQGEGKKARELAELAVCTLQGAPPATELAMAYSNKAQLHMLAQETADAVAWGERALALAEDLQATESLVHALNNVGTSRVYAGDASGWDELRRSLSLALEHDLEEHAARAYCNLTSALVTQRRYACAASFFAESIEYCNDRALDSWSTYLMAWRARSALEQGCWDDADADARAIVECQGMPPVTRLLALVVLGTLAARRGDPAAAALLDEAHRLAEGADEMQRVVPVATARAEAAWLAGDSQRCAAAARVGLAVALRQGEPWSIGVAATWLWRAGALQDVPAQCAAPFGPLLRGDWSGSARAWEDLTAYLRADGGSSRGRDPAQARRAVAHGCRRTGAGIATRRPTWAGAGTKIGNGCRCARVARAITCAFLSRRRNRMPRYLVERTFSNGLTIPMNGDGAKACLGVVAKNGEQGVTWVPSYVTADRKNTFCIYDGPTPDAIREVARRNGMGVDRVTEVSVLDPYFYHS